MITILSDTDDISSSYERQTLRITEQLNNRRHICNFQTIAQRIDEGKKVIVYDTMRLRDGSDIGTDTLFPIDTYEFSQKYRPGDRIYVDINGENQRRYTIDSIDHDAREVVLTQNLAAAVTTDTKCGKRIFGGIAMKPSDEEVGNDNTFIYEHSLQDWSALFDLKNVATRFENQYPREITGRMMRLSVALDTKVTLDSFATAWTEGGVGRAMSEETDDVIEGNQCQTTGATGAGTATWTKAISATDLTVYEHVRFWWKMAANAGSKVSALKIRIGNDASNYNEYNISHVGQNYEDCWSWESVILAEPDSVTGTPDLETVDWIQLAMTATGSIAAGDIFFDQMQATSGGFTLVNVSRGISKFENFPAAFIKPTALMEDMSKRQSMYWFIDREKDVHLFTTNAETSPFNINTTEETWGDLTIERDLETLRNRVPVRGAETVSANQYEQIETADGTQTSFRLDYKPSDLHVFVDDTGVGDAFVEVTVGVENLNDEADYEFMMNFQEKFVRNSTHSTLEAGDLIKFVYYPYIPVIVQVVDTASVSRMKAITGGDGLYDAPIIIDERIRTFTEARKRAQVELDLYSNAVVTCSFQTNKEGLHAGQIIRITDAARNVDDDFVIQKLSARTVAGEYDDVWSYSVTCASSLFGLIEFFQLLMKRSSKIPSDVTEGIQLVYNMDDVIELEDAWEHTVKSNEFNTGDLVNYQLEFHDMPQELITATGNVGSGLRPSWYGAFIGGETGEIGFEDADYTTGYVMKLQTDTGGDGLGATMRTVRRRPVNGGEEYTVKTWIELLAALTNVDTGGGFRLRLIEYASPFGVTPLQTTTIFSGETIARDFLILQDTHTMHASTTHVEIELGIIEAAGEVSVGEIHLIESGVDGQTNPAVAGFCETSA